MALLDKIKELFGGGGAEREEQGRHPDAQPVSAEELGREPTPEEAAAAAAAAPPLAPVESVAADPPPGATSAVAERQDNPVGDLEQPGVDTPPPGAGEPPAGSSSGGP